MLTRTQHLICIPLKVLASWPHSPREPLCLVMQLGGITLTLFMVDLASHTLGVLPAAGFYPPAWVGRAFFQGMTPFVISVRFASSFSIPLARSGLSSPPACRNCYTAPSLRGVMVTRIPTCTPSRAGGLTKNLLLTSPGTRYLVKGPSPSSSRGPSCAGPQILTSMMSTCLLVPLPLTSGTGRSI